MMDETAIDRRTLLGGLGACAIAGLGGTGLAAGPAEARGRRFARGINITHLASYPKWERWPAFVDAKASIDDGELKRLADLGLDFVRLPVDPQIWLDADAGRRRELDLRLQGLVQRLVGAGLDVILTGFARHSAARWRPADILADPRGAAFEAYLGFLLRLCGLAGDFGGERVAVEPMNEPQVEVTAKAGPDWSETQPLIVGRIRAQAPRLTLMLTGGAWSQIRGITALSAGGYDERTLFDVHYYDPFTFTHQGATWATPVLAYVNGVAFPAELTQKSQAATSTEVLLATRGRGLAAAEAARLRAEAAGRVAQYAASGVDERSIERDFHTLALWADREKIARERVIIGEFGALRPLAEAGMLDARSRERWLKAVRVTAEARGFGWAMWEYYSGFGLVADERTRELDPVAVRALGLGGGAR